MPKGNGDLSTLGLGCYPLPLVRNTVNAERQWRLSPRNTLISCGSSCQEHGECRKAMETGNCFAFQPSPVSGVRNTVNAERQWRQDQLVLIWTNFSSQEHGECRKAMETRPWPPCSSTSRQQVRNTVNAERQWRQG